MNLVRSLADGPAGVELLGGKGDALAALLAADMNVPAGFVITAPALRGREPGTPWPPDLLEAVTAAYRDLAGEGQAVAVRSSATHEDSAGASFAGQHETVLDVGSLEAVLEAVDRCHASLASEAAGAYRSTAGAADGEMAIVVQRMVAASAAGVAFTDDPTGRAPGHIVVEAVAGPGELLVSGQGEAQQVRLTRDAAIVDRVSPGDPVLSDEQAAEVARLALACAELRGGNQDIEYAFDGEGVLWLLQSRPITTAAGDTGEAGWVSEFDSPSTDDQAWTSANIQEVLPGLLTPLSMSAGVRNSHAGFVEGYREIGLIGRDETPPWIAFFYNRAFLNIGTTRLVAGRALGASGDGVEVQYLGGEASADLPTESLRERLPFMVRSLWPLAKALLGATSRTDRWEREVIAAEKARLALDRPSLTNEEIAGWIRRGEALSGRVFAHHLQVSGLASAAYTNLLRVLNSGLGEERAQAVVPTLLTGLTNVESARISIDIWNLSRVARNTDMREALAEPGFDPEGEGHAPAWRAAYRSFMRRHGHRGLREMEASTRTWRLDPTPVLATVRAYLDVDPAQSPVASLERQEAQRHALTVEIRRELKPAARLLYGRFLRDAQDMVALRERTKSIIVRAARMADELVFEAAGRMVSAGLIDEQDDVFFLAFEELLEWLEGANGGAGFRASVARRRREFERNRYVELPEKFRGRPVPIPPSAGDDATTLQGTGVSAGAVTGRARVIRDPGVDGGMQPGEILVAPVTDAGWTPLFGLASGLVVDIGSALSHGSTIAREYGLPAVVNVRRGTLLIRDGDLLHVDGAAGTVTIVERAGES